MASNWHTMAATVLGCTKVTYAGQTHIICSCRSLVFSGTVHWFVGRQAFIHYCGLHQV